MCPETWQNIEDPPPLARSRPCRPPTRVSGPCWTLHHHSHGCERLVWTPLLTAGPANPKPKPGNLKHASRAGPRPQRNSCLCLCSSGASSPWAAGARVPEGDTCGQNAGRRSPAGPAPQGYPTPVAPLRAPSFPHPDQLPPPVPLLPAAFGLVDTRGGGGRGRPGCQGRGRSWLCGLGSRRRGWPGPPSSLRKGHSSSCVVLSHPHPRGCAGPFPAGLSGCSRGAEPHPRNSGDFVPARHTPVPFPGHDWAPELGRSPGSPGHWSPQPRHPTCLGEGPGQQPFLGGGGFPVGSGWVGAHSKSF